MSQTPMIKVIFVIKIVISTVPSAIVFFKQTHPVEQKSLHRWYLNVYSMSLEWLCYSIPDISVGYVGFYRSILRIRCVFFSIPFRFFFCLQTSWIWHFDYVWIRKVMDVMVLKALHHRTFFGLFIQETSLMSLL